MTYAIFSIVANEVSPSGCSAYTYAQYSFSPYVRPPFFQFSEQLIDDWMKNGGTHPAYPFLTGSGGANQVGLFGYLGYRLVPDSVLHINPNLPPQIPHITYRTFYWRGWPIKAKSNYTHTTIKRAEHRAPLPTADQRFAHATIPIHVGLEHNATAYVLPVSGDLVVPNRQIGSIPTFPGNLIQCQHVVSSNDYLPGQFPIAAVDGAASTKWQPARANGTASLTVALPDSAVSSMITGFAFDWAHSPPLYAKVFLHDAPLTEAVDIFSADPPNTVAVVDLQDVELSKPYLHGVTDLNVIMPYKGNTTNLTLETPVPATRFATLLISGNQALGEVDIKAGNGTGATVAEWSILGASDGAGNGNSTSKAFRIRGVSWRG